MDLAAALSLHQAGRRAEAAAAYKAILAREPENAAVLHAYGVLLHQAGDSPEALPLLERAVARMPGEATFHFNLGLARSRLGRHAEAAASLREAARLKPDWPQPLYDLGNALAAGGARADAARAYRAALRLKPDYFQAEVNLANVLRADGKRAAAIAAYRRVLRQRPDLPEVHSNLGTALLEEADEAGAEAAFRAALTVQPDFPDALRHLVALLVKAKRFAEAVPVGEAARAAAPAHGGVAELYADALHGTGAYKAAADAYRAALAVQPDRISAKFGLAESLRMARDLNAAEAVLRPLVTEFPDAWQAHHDLANVVRHQGRFAEAEEGFRRAAALKESVRTLAPLGMVLRDLQKLEESTTILQRALRLAPADEDTRYNLATTYLTAGRLQDGFALYDARFAKFRPRPVPGRAWAGEELAGRTILVSAEQGLGDTLQFLRYVPELAARGATVLVRLQQPLLRLIADFPGILVVAEDVAALPSYDFHVSLMSLPDRLRVFDPKPIDLPYLHADQHAVARWRSRLAPLSGRRVGLVWQGNTGFGADHLRSIPPAMLAPLAHVGGVSFVSLQKEATTAPLLGTG